MFGKPLYDDEAEKLLHAHAINILQREMQLSEEEIVRLHESELEKLKDQAKIKDYLVVLVCRTVRDILHRHQREDEKRNGTTG